MSITRLTKIYGIKNKILHLWSNDYNAFFFFFAVRVLQSSAKLAIIKKCPFSV